MKRKNKIPFYQHLFVQVLVGFGAILVVFVCIIGIVYTNLYENSIEDTYRSQLKTQASRISRKMSDYVCQDDTEGAFLYQEYLETVANSENTDIWLIDNGDDAEELAREFTNVDIEDIDLSKEVNKVITEAKQQKIAYACGYDKIYEKTMMCVAAPIYGKKEEVVGIVLLNSYVTQKDALIKKSREYTMYSIVAGATLAVFFSVVLAFAITRPLARLRYVAAQLTKGDYKFRTNLKGKNEIAYFAQSMDTLAERLEENELERKMIEQARIDFFANVSHELRTPITVVRGYAESLADGVVPSEEKKHVYYKRMVSECQGMERLVGDLLTLSKMQNPHFTIVKEPTNLVQIFRDILRNYKAISEKKKVDIHFQCEKEIVMMMGDYDRLRQLFTNIIDNALKFSHEGGNIYVTLEQAEKIHVSIRDEGTGISEEELPHIFEKFYKSKLRQNAKGSGLGLVIAKYIVEKHEGEVKVSSQLGIGTEFCFEFQPFNGEMEL